MKDQICKIIIDTVPQPYANRCIEALNDYFAACRPRFTPIFDPETTTDPSSAETSIALTE